MNRIGRLLRLASFNATSQVEYQAMPASPGATGDTVDPFNVLGVGGPPRRDRWANANDAIMEHKVANMRTRMV